MESNININKFISDKNYLSDIEVTELSKKYNELFILYILLYHILEIQLSGGIFTYISENYRISNHGRAFRFMKNKKNIKHLESMISFKIYLQNNKISYQNIIDKINEKSSNCFGDKFLLIQQIENLQNTNVMTEKRDILHSCVVGTHCNNKTKYLKYLKI